MSAPIAKAPSVVRNSPTKSDLWHALQNVSFDEADVALPFSARLARENGWAHDFAVRVVEEYRRFAYLAQISPTSVTPSDEVDQAWHLHLLYTRHYWGAFTETMGAPLHHGPTKGGVAQHETFTDQYEATKALYKREFGEAPPIDIWPATEIRMGKAPTARRVLTSDYFVVKKPPRWTMAGAGAAIVALFALPTFSWAHSEFPETLNPETITRMVAHWYTEHTIPAVAITVIVLLVLGAFTGAFGGGKGNGRNGSGCGGSTDGGGSGSSGCSGCGGCGG